MMKILHVLDHSIPGCDGYSFRSQYIIETQKKMGLEPMVVTSPKHRSEIKSPIEVYSGISYYRTPFHKGLLSKIPYAGERGIITVLKKRIEEAIDKEKVDLIHAHSPSLCGYAASTAAKSKKLPFIYEIRALWEDAAVDQNKFKKSSLRYKISRGIETMVLKRADMITTIAMHLKKDIESRGILSDKICLTPNGVDTEKFRPIAKNIQLVKKHSLENKICIGFIGSFFRFEGLEFLVEAIPAIIKKRPDIKFMLIGAGEKMNEIRNKIHELGLNESVILTGKVPHEQVMEYYSIMDIMIYPRISERITELVTPLKTLEAMSMAKAVIGSNVGGIREIIEDNKNGLLFKAGDADDLIKKILYFAQNPEMRRDLGRNARIDMQNKREWSVIVKRYVDLYKEVLSKRN